MQKFRRTTLVFVFCFIQYFKIKGQLVLILDKNEKKITVNIFLLCLNKSKKIQLSKIEGVSYLDREVFNVLNVLS